LFFWFVIALVPAIFFFLLLIANSGSFVDPSWFALDASRGIETPGSKLFMRSTVILSDCAIYIPAAWLFTRVWHSDRSRRTQVLVLHYLPSRERLADDEWERTQRSSRSSFSPRFSWLILGIFSIILSC
jgi:hypothetical protein